MSSFKVSDVDLKANAGHGRSIRDLLGHDLAEAQAMDADDNEIGLTASANTSAGDKTASDNRSTNVAATVKDGTPVTPTPKKRGPKPAIDADGNVVASSAKKRALKAPAIDAEGKPVAPKKRAPKLDDDGNPIPPKKRGPKAPAPDTDANPVVKASGKWIPEEKNEPSEDGVAEDGGNKASATKTKAVKTSKVGKVAPVKSEEFAVEEDDDEEVDEIDQQEFTIAQPNTTEATQPPQTPKKSTNGKAKREIDGQMAPPSSSKPSSKKRGVAAEPGEFNDTPSKKPRKTPATGGAKHNKLPTSIAELSEADKLVAKMRKENYKWSDIEKAVTELTGQEVTKLSLSKRYARVMASITEWKHGDVERMLHVMNLVEKETADGMEAYRRKAEQEKWAKAAELMTAVGGDKYSAAALEKCYKKEKSDGFPHRATIEQVLSGQSSTVHEAENEGNEGDQEGDHEVEEEEGATGNSVINNDADMLEV